MDSDDRRYRDRSPSDRHRSRHHHHRDRSPRDKERDRESRRDRDRSASPGGRRNRREQSAENDPFNPYHEDKVASKKRDAIAAAAAAAERINAQIQAKLGGGGGTPAASSSGEPPSSAANLPNSAPRGTTETVVEDGDFIRDIEINHLMNRYTLTKGQTQAMIKTETGADVTTRGRYYPDKSQATEKEPPLYLHITSLTKEGLEKAISIVENLMAQDKEKSTPPAAGGFQRREDTPQGPPSAEVAQSFGGAPTGPQHQGDSRPPFQRGEYRRRWMEDRVLIGLDYLPGFNVRGQIVGPMGANVKHIQTETGCRVQIKGRGSQFIEQATGRESDEPTFLHILGQDPNDLARAVELSKDLVKTVTDSYNAFKANPRPQQQRYNNNSRDGGRGYRFSQDGRGNYQNRDYRGPQQSPPPNDGSAGSPTGASPQGANAQPDYTAYYAAVASGQDPYAAYGGYEAYVQYYQQYYAQYYAQMQQQQPANGGDASAGVGQGASMSVPGLDGVNQQQAPPSSSSQDNKLAGQYGAVPPPPGL
ncbi:hypothetical protein POJ06DRAFT_201850 [Lipomyces tetrasporus]|uniref:K Homology domain-containing protein n=1 Tax=Lipomyces tetrasporus TaxID=54092 RepID=A0AAD7QM45_9ASCO|nr:uncharacterized protein POJ06DRAFT_201850 [Lipomyces tetrasporus]KAJ8097416.1 hypothetical protein POJ06DRAFT_201850 [Lipomyces tetrasporus]